MFDRLSGMIVVGACRSALRSLTLLAGLAGILAGCRSDITKPDSQGTFTGTLSGDRTGKKSGWATVLPTSTSSKIYGATTSDDFHLELRPAGLLSVGTFQIGEASDQFYSVISFTLHAVDATSGTVTIESVSTTAFTESVKGSFNVTYASADEAFTFVGTFDARRCTSGCID